MSRVDLLGAIGLGLLPLLALGLARTAWAAWEVLLAIALFGMAVGILLGADPTLIYALPSRILGLLDNDLLQALPMFVLMGLLLDTLRVPDALFRTGSTLVAHRPGSPAVLALLVGALLGPLNGSAGASVASLARSVDPQLVRRGVPAPTRLALVAVAGTFGVLVPPSLVLILLGEAMLSAHTLAINASGRLDRVINTQDLMRGALLPSALLLSLSVVAALWSARRAQWGRSVEAPIRASRRQVIVAAAVTAFLVALLASIASGLLRAVEGAAAGALLLCCAGIAGGRLRGRRLGLLLNQTLALSGALFGLLVAATTFTLTLRMLGTDVLIASAVNALPGDESLITALGLAGVAAAALVLDAFELIFVVVPLLMPPLLTRVPDAQWVGVLVLLTLQTSFLLPPFGYALLMARSALRQRASPRALWSALWPFLAAQWLVLILVLLFPRLAHLGGPAGPESRARSVPSDEQYLNYWPPQDDEPAPENK